MRGKKKTGRIFKQNFKQGEETWKEKKNMLFGYY